MELPARVIVTCQILGYSNRPATLVALRPEGIYELHLRLQDGREHTVLMPVQQTCVVLEEPELEVSLDAAIER